MRKCSCNDSMFDFYNSLNYGRVGWDNGFQRFGALGRNLPSYSQNCSNKKGFKKRVFSSLIWYLLMKIFTF